MYKVSVQFNGTVLTMHLTHNSQTQVIHFWYKKSVSLNIPQKPEKCWKSIIVILSVHTYLGMYPIEPSGTYFQVNRHTV